MRRISRQLILASLCVFAVFLTVLTIFFQIFMPEFYVNWYEDEIIEMGEEIVTDMNENKMNSEGYNSNINILYGSYHCAIEILDEDGNSYLDEFERDLYSRKEQSQNSMLVYNQKTTAIDGIIYEVTIYRQPHLINLLIHAISEVYVYFVLLVLVLLVFLYFVYSRMVTKPLLNIVKSSQKMSDLDFEEHIEVTSQNEMSLLADNLNQMSMSLKESMTQLQEELDNKTKQEKFRKEFVSNVSHELKTPLSVIRCYVEMMEDGFDMDKQSDYAEIVYDEIEKMQKLVRQMLDLGKLESEDFKLSKEMTDLSDLIYESVRKQKFLADKRNLVFITNIQEMIVSLDKARMQQVIDNLISNSIKYSDESTVLEVKAYQLGHKYKFEILNECERISQNEADEFFMRFTKKDKSHGEEGTGLGLSIVKAILDHHNYKHGVRITEYGICFYFEIDLNDS